MKKQLDIVRQLAAKPAVQSEKAHQLAARARVIDEQQLASVAGGLRWGNTAAG